MRWKPLSLAILVFSSCAFLLYWSIFTAIDPPVGKSDAIVILAGEHRERAPAAAMLWRDGYAGRVILTNDGVFSGWSTKHNRNLYQIEWAEEELVGLGVPRERIVKLPFYGSGTIYDALSVKRYFYGHALAKVIIVTSDYHARRALSTFRTVFAGLPVRFTAYPAKSFGITTEDRAVEWGKLLYYWMRYRVLGLIPEQTEHKAIIRR